jgi:ribulose-5-phosphate 4-epimerase/fuculose-1-phosphate aldolase
MGATMAKRKTSAEKARDDEEQSQLDNMLGGAFGDIETLEAPAEEVETPIEETEESKSDASAEPTDGPTGPPTGPPSGPPTGPPTGPPPPSPSDAVEEQPQEPLQEDSEDVPPETSDEPAVEEEISEVPDEPAVEEDANATPESMEQPPAAVEPVVSHEPQAEPVAEPSNPMPAATPSDQNTLDLLAEKEAELERLHMENARLRQSVVGATEVIEELEEPPMPPLVEDNIVIPPYIVSDFVRLGRQLDREHLVRATMGSMAMIHPEQPGVMIATRHMVTLPRMNERSLCAAPLGSTSPRGAPSDWHALEVVLASVSMVTGGPAAVIHMHGPHTTAASCEKDLVLLTPIDEIGKQHIGKIIIVDPDPDHPEDYLRQVAEALNQGGMRCVVVRGNGAYAVGADFDQAWANAAMVEHSMQIHLLARQANLKT